VHALNYDAAQQAELLRIARRSLELYFESGRRPEVETADPALQQPRGAFVTLHRVVPPAPPALRGCIGTFEARESLNATVTRMAIAAATTDPRFPPVSAEELPQLSIEISVLSPRRQAAAGDVEVGRHGIYISAGARRGVLLPQVAVEHGWDRATFLDHTCRKAGLPPDAWRSRDDLRIEVFTADVFGERERAG